MDRWNWGWVGSQGGQSESLEEGAAACVSLEAEPKRAWVRQEPKRQLLERHSLVF